VGSTLRVFGGVEPPALGDSTVLGDANRVGNEDMRHNFVWLGGYHLIRWDPPYVFLVGWNRLLLAIPPGIAMPLSLSQAGFAPTKAQHQNTGGIRIEISAPSSSSDFPIVNSPR